MADGATARVARGWIIAMWINAALFNQTFRFASWNEVRSRLLHIVVATPIVAAAFTPMLLLAARMS
jgi:hypothetical protein